MSGVEGDRKLACEVRRFEWLRYDHDELAPPERARLEAHLSGCAHCQGLRAGQVSARAALSPAEVSAQSVAILSRLDQPAPRPAGLFAWFRPQLLAGVLALTVAAVVLVPVVREGLHDGPRIRTKGATGPALEMWVNTPEGARPGSDGETLSEGDQIQFRYRASGRQYLLVVSVDSKGVTTPLYPEGPGESVKVSPDGEHVLEGSVILDDAKGPERIFAFFSDQPLSMEEVMAQLSAELPAGADLSRVEKVEISGAQSESLWINKE